MRAFDLALNRPWAITEDALRTVLAIAARENLDPEAVAAKLGRPLDNTRNVSLREGVAVIPVHGPIFRYANLFTAISGATPIETLALDITRALDDGQVKALVLDIDSPGGEASGVNELADLLYGARGRKPIVAYVGTMAASAAYWLASACGEIVCDATAELGSIGVVAGVPDPDARQSRTIEFVSSQSPNKRVDVRTEGGRAEIQQRIDDLADVFVQAVARNRQVSVDTVLEQFGQGSMLIASKAITRGMADRVGSFEQVIADLTSRTQQQPSARRYGATALHTKETSMSRGFDWKGVFGGLFAAAKEAETADAFDVMSDEEQAVGDVGDGQPAANGDGARVYDPKDGEITQLRQQIQAERDARHQVAATAYADELVATNKIFPTERQAVINAYTRAAGDDTHDNGDRLALLQAQHAARPAHQLTKELVPDAGVAAVLPNSTATTTATGQPMTDARRTELLSATPLGQAVLRDKK